MNHSDYLKSFFTEHWKYIAVSTACKLNIFDYLIKPISSDEVASLLKLNTEKTAILLNALYQCRFVEKKGDLFQINDLSDYLRDNHQNSLKYACMNWAGEHLLAWQKLDYSIETGKSSFENIYRCNFFEYIDKYPEKLKCYHRAMYEYARDDYKNLSHIINFSIHKSIIDCGGGLGAIINTIKANYPQIICYLFDLPNVVDLANISGINKIGGDFFEEIPQVAEAMILSRVLHDWDDDKALIILHNCYQALPIGGSLYVIENCTDKINVDLSLLSLNMAVMCSSYERSSTTYQILCKKAGFDFRSIMSINELQMIMTYKKI